MFYAGPGGTSHRTQSASQFRKDMSMTPKTKGIKHDKGKPMLGLLSSKWLIEVAKVMTFGVKKYNAHNWRGGLDFSRVYDAAQRHLVAWNDGEDLDPETKLPHLAHASCCLMFLMEFQTTRPKLDDRYKA